MCTNKMQHIGISLKRRSTLPPSNSPNFGQRQKYWKVSVRRPTSKWDVKDEQMGSRALLKNPEGPAQRLEIWHHLIIILSASNPIFAHSGPFLHPKAKIQLVDGGRGICWKKAAGWLIPPGGMGSIFFSNALMGSLCTTPLDMGGVELVGGERMWDENTIGCIF